MDMTYVMIIDPYLLYDYCTPLVESQNLFFSLKILSQLVWLQSGVSEYYHGISCSGFKAALFVYLKHNFDRSSIRLVSFMR